MNPTSNSSAAAEARSRFASVDAAAAGLIEHSLAWHPDDVTWTPVTGSIINPSGYETGVDSAISDASIVAGEILPRLTAYGDAQERVWVEAWRENEEPALSAWPRIRQRLSMLGLVLAGDAMIVGAVLLVTGVARF